MGKNYMPEIARILGIKMNELFDVVVEGGKDSSCGPFYFDDKWRIMDNDDGLVPLWFFEKILTGKYTIQEHSWRPKEGKLYWYVDIDEDIISARFDGTVWDFGILNMGNCFPNEEAAEAAIPEMLTKFKKVREEVRK